MKFMLWHAVKYTQNPIDRVKCLIFMDMNQAFL